MVPQQLDDKVKLSNKDKTYIAPHSRAPAVSHANGNGGGLRTYSRIPLHLWGKTPGAADAVIDSNKRNRLNIVNRTKISTDATVRKTRVGRKIQTPARFVQMVHAIVAPNDIYGGPNRMYVMIMFLNCKRMRQAWQHCVKYVNCNYILQQDNC